MFNSLGSTTGQQAASNVIFGKKPGVIAPVQQPAPSPITTQASHPGVLPTTPVKKITAADGSTTEFHAPVVKAPDDLSNKYNTSTGVLNTNYKDPNASATNTSAPADTTSKPDVTYPGLVGGAVTAAKGNEAIGQRAADIAAQYGKQISDIGQKGAGLTAGQLTTGTSPVAEGNAAITAQTIAAQQQAAATGEQAALAGTGQQLTANQNTATALNTAAGLTPEALRYGGAAGGTLNPLNNLDSIATQVINGQISPAQAKAMGGGISTWEGALNQALLAKNPQYNEAQVQGKYEATQGAAGTQAGTVQAYTSALQQGQNLQSQLTSLITTFGLNPTDINKANQGLQVIANNVSDPRYKILQNYVNDIANTYAQVLTPPGGSATDTTRGIATSMLDATMAGQGLITVMKSLDEAAKAKIAGVPTAGGAGTTGGSGFKEGQTSSDGSLVYKGGKWVKA